MSKHETPMTEWYWREVLKKGTLIKEYVAIERAEDGSNGSRFMDGLVIMDGPFKISDDVTRDIAGKDVVVIQSKNRRLGMGLIGQVIVSRDLVERLGADVIKSVGVCTEIDTVMHKMLRKHPRCRAVVYKPTGKLGAR